MVDRIIKQKVSVAEMRMLRWLSGVTGEDFGLGILNKGRVYKRQHRRGFDSG